MATLYTTNVKGPGDGRDYSYPNGFATLPYITLMLNPARPAVMLVSTEDKVTAPTVKALFTAPTLADLKTYARTTVPTAGELRLLNNWANSAGLTDAPAGSTWLEAVNFIARQVDAAADLESVFLYEG